MKGEDTLQFKYEYYAKWVRKNRWFYLYLPVSEEVIREVWEMGRGEERKYKLLFFSSILFLLAYTLFALSIDLVVMPLMVIASLFLIPEARDTFLIKPALVYMKGLYLLAGGGVTKIGGKRLIFFYLLSFTIVFGVLYSVGFLAFLINAIKSIFGGDTP